MKNYFLSIFVLSILFVSCSKEEETVVKEEKETITYYKDVELKLMDSDSDDFGIAFSSKTGKTFKKSEINESNIADIDIVSYVFQGLTAFSSPDEADETKGINGATKTKIQHINIKMTVEEFEAMKDDSMLKSLEIVHDEEARNSVHKGIFLFENAAGKKGAIRTKIFNAQRVIIDVKVMK